MFQNPPFVQATTPFPMELIFLKNLHFAMPNCPWSLPVVLRVYPADSADQELTFALIPRRNCFGIRFKFICLPHKRERSSDWRIHGPILKSWLRLFRIYHATKWRHR